MYVYSLCTSSIGLYSYQGRTPLISKIARCPNLRLLLPHLPHSLEYSPTSTPPSLLGGPMMTVAQHTRSTTLHSRAVAVSSCLPLLFVCRTNTYVA